MADFVVYRGDTLSFSVEVVDENGTPIDLSGCSLWMTAKKKATLATDPDASCVWQVGTEFPLTGITVTNASLGLASILVPQGHMSGLPSYPATLVYDVQIEDGAGNVWTADYGTLKVYADATVSTFQGLIGR